jgi:hypothetical protein
MMKSVLLTFKVLQSMFGFEADFGRKGGEPMFASIENVRIGFDKAKYNNKQFLTLTCLNPLVIQGGKGGGRETKVIPVQIADANGKGYAVAYLPVACLSQAYFPSATSGETRVGVPQWFGNDAAYEAVEAETSETLSKLQSIADEQGLTLDQCLAMFGQAAVSAQVKA